MPHGPQVFGGLTLDRCAEWRDDPAWVARHEAAADSHFLLLDTEGRLLANADAGAPRLLGARERRAWFASTPATLLGAAGDEAWFALFPPPAALAAALGPAGEAPWVRLRDVGQGWSAFDAGLFAYARALGRWQALVNYCSVCGAPLELVSAGHRARCTAPGCGQLQFPRTDAAIITIIEHEGACLLGRQATWAPGRWSTLAGFVEPGETLEAAVRREVWEEAGIHVGECRYFASQPWPFPASLMVGFVATALDSTIALRDGELEAARWFTPEDLMAGIGDGSFVPSAPVSVSWHLLAWWLRERAGVDLAALAPA